MQDHEETYEKFWKEIVENPDGSLNLDQIKRELHDFRFVMEQVPRVYDHVTGGRVSNIMTYAHAVIAEADDHANEELDHIIDDEKKHFVCEECEKELDS